MSNKKTTEPKENTKPQLKIRDLKPNKDAKGGKVKIKPPSNGDPCDGSEFH